MSHYNRSRTITYAKIGEIYLITRKLYEISIEYFQKAVEMEPGDYTYYRLGQAYMYSGISTGSSTYYTRAEEALNKAIQLKGPNCEYAEGELKTLHKYWR